MVHSALPADKLKQSLDDKKINLTATGQLDDILTGNKLSTGKKPLTNQPGIFTGITF